MRLKGILVMELGRMLRSWKLWAAILGLFVMCMAATWYTRSTVVNMFGVMTYLSQFGILIILFAAIPFGAAFSQECNSGYARMIVGRKGYGKYTSSIYFVSCVSAYLTVFAGLMLYLVVLSSMFPLFEQEYDRGYTSSLCGDMLLNGHVWNYLICRVHLVAMEAVLCVGLGVMFSVFITDSFTAVAVPFVCGYMLEAITVNLPAPLNFETISHGYSIFDAGVGWNLLYVFIFYASILTIAYFVFAHWVQRRMENELC